MTDSSLLTDSQLAKQWSKLLALLDSANERLMTDLESCWRDLQCIPESQIEEINATAPAAIKTTGLDAFQKARAEAGATLLSEPPAQWERRRTKSVFQVVST